MQIYNPHNEITKRNAETKEFDEELKEFNMHKHRIELQLNKTGINESVSWVWSSLPAEGVVEKVKTNPRIGQRNRREIYKETGRG